MSNHDYADASVDDAKAVNTDEVPTEVDGPQDLAQEPIAEADVETDA